jgi:hypothetical protein
LDGWREGVSKPGWFTAPTALVATGGAHSPWLPRSRAARKAEAACGRSGCPVIGDAVISADGPEAAVPRERGSSPLDVA